MADSQDTLAPIRVLLVEGSDESARPVLGELDRCGYSIRSQRVESEAAMERALEEEWDLIIADYQLPEFGALAALALVARRQLEIPLVVVSAGVNESLLVEAMRLGARDYVLKDNLRRLSCVVERELRETEIRKAWRRAEAALKESESRLLRAQRIGQIGSWEVDCRTQKLYWSPETYRIFGRKPSEFQPDQESFFEAIHPEDRERVRAAMELAMRSGGAYSIDHRILLPDGSQRIVHEQSETIFGPNGEPARREGTVQDVTDLRTLEEQLRQSQKMEAMGNLAGGVAHDFNNILTVILGYAELIASNPTLSDETRQQITHIVVSADRGSRLTNRLLTFSRKRLMQLRPLELNRMLEGWAPMLQRLLGETIRLELETHEPLPWVDADAGMLEQVLVSLSVNARDAMPGGGRLTIGTGVERAGDSQSSAGAWAHAKGLKGEFVKLWVSDTGVGMDADTLDHAFEPFYSTKEVGKSSGLGLSTAYAIVRQHQGWIHLESQVNEGTRATVFLPALALSPKEVASSVMDESGEAPRGSETLLLVEDEAALRPLAARILERRGYQVYQASTGPEALLVWKDHGSEIDLVLTDMVMPDGMTGRDLSIALRKQKPDLPIIFTTGYSPDVVRGDLDLREGVNFIAKPYSAQTLCAAVRRRLDAAGSETPTSGEGL